MNAKGTSQKNRRKLLVAAVIFILSLTIVFLALASIAFGQDEATPGVDHNQCLNCHLWNNHNLPTMPYNCSLCHDRDNAVTLKGVHAPNIGAFLRTSAHMRIPVLTDPNDPLNDQLSERCVQCHDNTDNSNPKLQRLPFNLTNEENLCFACHRQGGQAPENQAPVSAPDIQSQFLRNSRHAITGTTADGLTGAKVECSSCHNPHVVQDGASDATKKVVNPFNTFNLWTGSFTEFCLKCHQDNANTPKKTDTDETFVPYTIKFPEIDSVLNPFFPGWDKTAYRQSAHGEKVNGVERLQCNKCHQPHGSDNNRLNAFFTGDGQQSVDFEKKEVTYDLQDVLDDASYPIQWPVEVDANGRPTEIAFGDLEPWLPAGEPNSLIPSRAFLRFKLNLPKDAKILQAKLMLTSNIWNSPYTSRNNFTANISLIDQDNVSQFSDDLTTNNPTWGLPTINNTSINWSATKWSIGQTIESSDLKYFVESFINRSGYNESTGSYIGFRIDEGNANTQVIAEDQFNGNGWRGAFALKTFKNFESSGSVQAAKLKIVYQATTPRPSAERYDLAQGEENLCFQCHRPGNDVGAPDIYTPFDQPNTHLKLWESNRHKDTEDSTDLSAPNRHSECYDCHDPHKAKKGNHVLGNNLASGPITGAKGVGVINGAAGSTPLYYPLSQITFEYELCFKCHSSNTTGYTGQDKAMEFNPNNAAYHPIEGLGKNLGIKDEAFTPGTPWNPTPGDDPDYGLTGNIDDPNSRIDPNFANGARVTCSDCHGNSDENAAKGPHGSTNPKILKKQPPELCLQCHRKEVYVDLTGMRGLSRNWFHYTFAQGHWDAGNVNCTVCHKIHGTVDKANLINEDNLEVRHENGQIACVAHHREDYATFMRINESYPHFNENYDPSVYLFNDSFTANSFMDAVNTTANWDIAAGEIKMQGSALWSAQPSWDVPDTGTRSNPALADLDGDSDFDLLVGEQNGGSYAFENTGSNTAPVWSRNPSWDPPGVSSGASPAFADLDADGDSDLMIGSNYNGIVGYKNTGTSNSPSWQAEASWNITLPNGVNYATPSLADLDGDGDIDLLAGHYNDTIDFPIYAYKNTGTSTSPTWTSERGWELFAIGLYSKASPDLADIDGDNDFDLMVNNKAYENTGSSSSLSWTRQTRWDAPGPDADISPAFSDLDSNGQIDLLIGTWGGISFGYKNTLSYASNNIVTSTTVDIVPETITKATLTATEDNDPGTSVSYQLSRDGGQTWEDVTNGQEHVFASTNSETSDLRWRATLSGTSYYTPIITDIRISYTVQLQLALPAINELVLNPISTSQIGLSWDKSADNGTGVIRYKVERAADEGGAPGTFTEIATTSNNSFIDSGLTSNTKYWYRVRAQDQAGNYSDYSQNKSTTTLAEAPTLAVASDGTLINQIEVSWNAPATSVDSYKVYRDGRSNTGTLVYNSNGTSFTDNVSNTDTHTYYIYSVNSEGRQNYNAISDTGYAMSLPATAPAAPTIGTAEALSTTSIRWNFTDNADNEDGFKLHDENENEKANIQTSNLNSIEEDGLSPNTSYTRHVHAYNGVGNSLASTNATAFTLAAAPGISSDKTEGEWTNTPGVKFTNEAGFGSGSVEYYRYAYNQNKTHEFRGNEAQWSSSTLSVSATEEGAWYLHVKSYNGNDVGGAILDLGPFYYENESPTIPTGLSFSGTSTSETTLNWLASTDTGGSNFIGYRIEKAFDNAGSPDTFTPIDTDTESPFLDRSLSPNTQYWYRIKAYDGAKNESGYSQNASIVTLAEAPTLASATDGTLANQIEVSWAASLTADHYHIYKDGAAGVGTLVYDASGTSFVDNVGDTDIHTYYIYAVNSAAANSTEYTSDTGYSAQPPAAPTISTPQALSSTSIKWNFIDNANNEDGFKLHDSNHDTKVSVPIPDLTYLDETGLLPNTQYTRHVHSYNSSGDSLASANATIYTLADPPTIPLASDGILENQIQVSWVASASADHYHVYKDGKAGVGTMVYNSSGTSFVDSVGDTNTHTYYIYSANAQDANSASYVLDTGYASSTITVPADQALALNLSNSLNADSMATITDITANLSDNNLVTATYDISIQGTSKKAVALKINREANGYSKVILRFYVTNLLGSPSSQPPKGSIYAYNSNGDSLNTSTYVQHTVSSANAWYEVDITSLKDKMSSFGWMKYRLVATNKGYKISEARIKLIP